MSRKIKTRSSHFLCNRPNFPSRKKKNYNSFSSFLQPLLCLLRVFEYFVNWSIQAMNLVMLWQQLLHDQLLTLTKFLTSTLDQLYLNLTLTLKIFLKLMVTQILNIFLRQNISCRRSKGYLTFRTCC